MPDIYSKEWCNLIFESKNKEYGAFRLRQVSSKVHLIALAISTFLFGGTIMLPDVLNPPGPAEDILIDKDRIIYIYLDPVTQNSREEEINAVLMGQRKALRNTDKFTSPVIQEDAEVVENNALKTQAELTESKSAIGIINYDKGTDSLRAGIPVSEDQISGEGYEDVPYEMVEQPPEPEGGMSAFYMYISRNLKYPDQARKSQIEGKVFVAFIVDADGSLTDIKILRGLAGGFDEEALKVIQNAPKWKPGRQQNRPVRVQMILPIVFRLNN